MKLPSQMRLGAQAGMRKRKHILIRLTILAMIALVIAGCPLCLHHWRQSAHMGGTYGATFKAESVSEWYEERHGGNFAPDLLALHHNWLGEGDVAREAAQEEAKRTIYIPWPKGRSGTPGEYPLAYSRRLSDNHGWGIYVVLVNQKVFFDWNARWLRRFVNEHPDLTIPCPDDLKSKP